jgi:hypothetical protein
MSHPSDVQTLPPQNLTSLAAHPTRPVLGGSKGRLIRCTWPISYFAPEIPCAKYRACIASN